MELPDEIEWPEAVVKVAVHLDDLMGEWVDGSIDLKSDELVAGIATLIDMVRRFYWQRNELLRLSTAYPAVMKEKLERDWEAR